MTTTLVISPHLDDAVLSLGGSIAAWVATGRRVVIATVYTTGPPLSEIARHMHLFADFATRRQEDTRACAALGAERRWLDQVERAFRRPFLGPLEYFAPPPSRDGFETLASTTAALDALRELDPEHILVPIGIGSHIDHVETLLAATDWAVANGWSERVAFYEDFYALSAVLRARHPIARQRTWSDADSPLARSPALAVILDDIAAVQRGASATDLLAAPLRDARWTVESSPIDEPAKLAAVACYGSQVRAFGGLDDTVAALRAYHAWWRGEPLWRAS